LEIAFNRRDCAVTQKLALFDLEKCGMSRPLSESGIFQEDFSIGFARPEHIAQIKGLVDANRHVFGFVVRSVFYDALETKTLIVAERGEKVIGFIRYHHRKRDLQTTLYDICVAKSERGKNIGQGMMAVLIEDCRNFKRTTILLKCPSHLEANTFYEKNGFCCIDSVIGKRQKLNVWRLDLTSRGKQ
jgi:GNAT superfamily N-acetyltransferase